jgi:hypothetical protein
LGSLIEKMATSFRKYDSNAEQEVAKFLDENFYKNNVSEFKRFTNKEDQLKGKDVEFSLGDLKNIIIDEKAQIYYVNKNIPTFAFEINFLRVGGILTRGWLFDESKETEYYLLIWITAEKDRNFNATDITKLDCLLVKREAILVFLIIQGLTNEFVNKISSEIREKEIPGKQQERVYDSCYFYYSPHLAEKPINIVIRKEKLKELAIKTFIVEKKV